MLPCSPGVSRNLASPYILLLLRVARREFTVAEHRARDARDVTVLFTPNSQRLLWHTDREGKSAIYAMAVEKIIEKTEVSEAYCTQAGLCRFRFRQGRVTLVSQLENAAVGRGQQFVGITAVLRKYRFRGKHLDAYRIPFRPRSASVSPPWRAPQRVTIRAGPTGIHPARPARGNHTPGSFPASPGESAHHDFALHTADVCLQPRQDRRRRKRSSPPAYSAGGIGSTPHPGGERRRMHREVLAPAPRYWMLPLCEPLFRSTTRALARSTATTAIGPS